MSLESVSAARPSVRENDTAPRDSLWSMMQGSSADRRDSELNGFWDKALNGAQKLFGIEKKATEETDDDLKRERSQDSGNDQSGNRLSATPGFSSSRIGSMSLRYQNESGVGRVNFGRVEQRPEAEPMARDERPLETREQRADNLDRSEKKARAEEPREERPKEVVDDTLEEDDNEKKVRPRDIAILPQINRRMMGEASLTRADSKAAQASAMDPAKPVEGPQTQLFASVKTNAIKASQVEANATGKMTPISGGGNSDASVSKGLIHDAASLTRDLVPTFKKETAVAASSVGNQNQPAISLENAGADLANALASESAAKGVKAGMDSQNKGVSLEANAAKAVPVNSDLAKSEAVTRVLDQKPAKPLVSQGTQNTHLAKSKDESQVLIPMEKGAKIVTAEKSEQVAAESPKKLVDEIATDSDKFKGLRGARPMARPSSVANDARQMGSQQGEAAARSDMERPEVKPFDAKMVDQDKPSMQPVEREAHKSNPHAVAQKAKTGKSVDPSALKTQGFGDKLAPDQSQNAVQDAASHRHAKAPRPQAPIQSEQQATVSASREARVANNLGVSAAVPNRFSNQSSGTNPSNPNSNGVSLGGIESRARVRSQGGNQSNSQGSDQNGKQEMASVTKTASQVKGGERAPQSNNSQGFDASLSQASSSRKSQAATRAQATSYSSKTTQEVKEVYQALMRGVDQMGSAQKGDSAVNIRISFQQGGSLNMKLALENGHVKPMMQTDLPGLETMIKSQWNELATEMGNRGIKLGIPQFSQSSESSNEGRQENFQSFEQQRENARHSQTADAGNQRAGQQNGQSGPNGRRGSRAGSDQAKNGDAGAQASESQAQESTSDQELEAYA